MRYVSELLVPGFGRPVLLCSGKMPRDWWFLVFVVWDMCRTFMCLVFTVT